MNTKTRELPENIKTWVDALESGEYSQTKGRLYHNAGYCCLGVYASAVMGLSDTDITAGDDLTNSAGPASVYRDIKEVLMPCVYEDGMHMNDSGYSFVDIAKMIREAY
jgi:hypothetical protein